MSDPQAATAILPVMLCSVASESSRSASTAVRWRCPVSGIGHRFRRPHHCGVAPHLRRFPCENSVSSRPAASCCAGPTFAAVFVAYPPPPARPPTPPPPPAARLCGRLQLLQRLGQRQLAVENRPKRVAVIPPPPMPPRSHHRGKSRSTRRVQPIAPRRWTASRPARRSGSTPVRSPSQRFFVERSCPAALGP